MTTIINAWMPYSEDGELFYRLMMALTAIIGLLVTSVLIGIITSAIEEKITNLKRGNSIVLEENHVVVLGFVPGEYTLIKQLILAAADQRDCIVIASNMERDEVEQYIRDNVDVPKNIRIICRNIDIFNPVDLLKCGVDKCRTIIVNPTDDMQTTKALLAVSNIINNTDNDKVRIGAIVSQDEYRFPPSIAQKHNVTTLQTNDIIARIIAHSCTQSGLSDTFREIFNFEGSELYNMDFPEAHGMSFGELMIRMDDGVPVGICKDFDIEMNPKPDRIIQNDETVVVFAREKGISRIVPAGKLCAVETTKYDAVPMIPAGKTVIIGYNETIEIVLNELPENVEHVTIAGVTDSQKQVIKNHACRSGMKLTYSDGDTHNEEFLLNLCSDAKHVVVLNDHLKDSEKSDMEVIFILLKLRDIRTRFGIDYNITVELQLESSQRLAATNDSTDYIVASNMSSLFLAQLAESPELFGAFTELLNNDGNEIYQKMAYSLHCSGYMSIAEIRRIAYTYGYIVLGYRKVDGNNQKNVYNPPLDSKVTLTENDMLIVIGEK